MHRQLHRTLPSATRSRLLFLQRSQWRSIHQLASLRRLRAATQSQSTTACRPPPLLSTARSYASQPSIQLGATSPQEVGQLLAAASAGEVDKMREVLSRNNCSVNDGDYDRRKVSQSVSQSVSGRRHDQTAQPPQQPSSTALPSTRLRVR